MMTLNNDHNSNSIENDNYNPDYKIITVIIVMLRTLISKVLVGEMDEAITSRLFRLVRLHLSRLCAI